MTPPPRGIVFLFLMLPAMTVLGLLPQHLHAPVAYLLGGAVAWELGREGRTEQAKRG